MLQMKQVFGETILRELQYCHNQNTYQCGSAGIRTLNPFKFLLFSIFRNNISHIRIQLHKSRSNSFGLARFIEPQMGRQYEKNMKEMAALGTVASYVPATRAFLEADDAMPNSWLAAE